MYGGSISVTNTENSFESSYILPVSYAGTAVGAYSSPPRSFCSRIAVSLMHEKITVQTSWQRHVLVVTFFIRDRACVVRTLETVFTHVSQ
jgi:hypothetical protein